jgi:hypothetical protein
MKQRLKGCSISAIHKKNKDCSLTLNQVHRIVRSNTTRPHGTPKDIRNKIISDFKSAQSDKKETNKKISKLQAEVFTRAGVKLR